jgi:hypothetical protein
MGDGQGGRCGCLTGKRARTRRKESRGRGNGRVVERWDEAAAANVVHRTESRNYIHAPWSFVDSVEVGSCLSGAIVKACLFPFAFYGALRSYLGPW